MLVQSYDPAGFPEFTLPKAGGGEFNSADYIGKQPVVVVFYRGYF
jgi:peroxiredoxin